MRWLRAFETSRTYSTRCFRAGGYDVAIETRTGVITKMENLNTCEGWGSPGTKTEGSEGNGSVCRRLRQSIRDRQRQGTQTTIKF